MEEFEPVVSENFEVDYRDKSKSYNFSNLLGLSGLQCMAKNRVFFNGVLLYM